MADAITLDKPANPAPRTDLDVEPQDTPEAEPETLSEPVAPLEDSVAPKAVYRSPAIGKVFFHNPDDGLDYVCSGSVINSPSKNVVSTAGHCVHNGDGGGWMEDWTFVPEYDKGNRPYGTWEWQTMTTFQGWTEDGSYDWDVAFVNMQQLNGSEIVNVTGGHGMIVNDSKEVDVTIFGYPAEDPFDGESQMYCEGTTYPRWFTSQIGFDCLMTGGSSGGPFLQDYSNDNLLGYLNGVISNGPPETSYSKYFDDDVSELFNGIKG
ncbi:trypsin-like serine peptidase [Salininema proteolyticum]|uniref:Trypsin-like serine peptidase n=1 Tax=Salininema proteolyticum TaxID=1607685 RepID=A0ABV8U1U3_9ACTN